jgi:hypothetical protein
VSNKHKNRKWFSVVGEVATEIKEPEKDSPDRRNPANIRASSPEEALTKHRARQAVVATV